MNCPEIERKRFFEVYKGKGLHTRLCIIHYYILLQDYVLLLQVWSIPKKYY